MKSLLIALKILCVKNQFRVLKSFVLSFCLVLVISLAGLSFVSLADVNDLMIGTGSNALMTMELGDEDYGISTFSSLASIDNSVDYDSVLLFVRLINEESGMYEYSRPDIIDDWGNFNYYVPSGYSVDSYGFCLNKGALPAPGRYRFQMDYSSVVSVEYTTASLVTTRKRNNVVEESASVSCWAYTETASGDFYTNFVGEFGSIDSLRLSLRLDDVLSSGSLIAGRVKVAFSVTTDSIDVDVVSTVDSEADYQAGVSSSLSDLSSSVDTMTDEISGVTEAIQHLQGAMEPHYNNVLTQLHHITEQLHAFYDQIYNNIHLKEYALWQDIKTAIENIDLEVNVNLDKLKTSIDNMSTAIQNKLQSVQESITNGFDNQGINQDAAELDQSLQEYEEAEQTVLDQVNDSLDDFEFDSGFDEYKTTISVFSDFLQDLYDSSGGFKVVINLSLMLSIAGIVIGVYRFRDGG